MDALTDSLQGALSALVYLTLHDDGPLTPAEAVATRAELQELRDVLLRLECRMLAAQYLSPCPESSETR